MVGLDHREKHSSGEEELQGKSKGKRIDIAQEGDGPTVELCLRGKVNQMSHRETHIPAVAIFLKV